MPYIQVTYTYVEEKNRVINVHLTIKGFINKYNKWTKQKKNRYLNKTDTFIKTSTVNV